MRGRRAAGDGSTVAKGETMSIDAGYAIVYILFGLAIVLLAVAVFHIGGEA